MNLRAQLRIGDGLSGHARSIITSARAALREGVPAGARLLVDEAKLNVPVDTGNLRDHIHSEPLEDSDNRQIYQIAPFYEASNGYGFDPAYARRIEYGFIGVDKLGRHYHHEPQPYMRPAKDIQGPAAVGLIKQIVATAVRGQ